jgi:hypothetical protein
VPLCSHGDRPVRRVALGSPGVCLCIDAMPTSLLSWRHMQCDSGHRLWTTAVIGAAVKRAAKFPSAALKPRHHVACGVRWSAGIGSLLTSIYLASTRRVGPHVEGHASQRDQLLLRMPGSHTPVVTGNANRYTPLVGIPLGIRCISDELSELIWPRDLFIASTRQPAPVVLLGRRAYAITARLAGW